MLGVYFGVDKMSLTGHTAVISKSNPIISEPKLIAVGLLVVNNFWFHGC
jgi:hypothetical protein